MSPSSAPSVRVMHTNVGVSVGRHLRKWFLSIGLGGLPRPRLNVVRQAGLVSRLRATEFTEDGRGLLMVSGEVAVVPQARVELGPNPVLRAVWLGRRGHHSGAGGGGIPGHPAGDHDVHS